MKKESEFLLITIFAILFLIAFFSAAEDESVEKAYSCLKSQLKDNCAGTSNIEQASFSLLAMSYDSKYQSDCESLLKNKKKENCWSDTESGACTLKATSLAILALKNIGEKTEDSINWILSKKSAKTALTWILEIDASNMTECTVNGKKITVNENKKLSGQDPAGLVKSYNNYWFEITNLNKNYTVSCNKDFITTLLYKKPGSSVIHVPSSMHSASAGDSITEAVNSFCFATGNACDYEGSLWSALALAKQGEDISFYLPYLTAMSEDAVNKRHFPSAFLYMLTNDDEYYSDIVKQQIGKKYWEVGNRKLYDTSLALLSLIGSESDEVISAKEYLLSIQEKSGDRAGCWTENTAFILFAAWPKEATKAPSKASSTDCETYGYFCAPSIKCSQSDQLNNFYCPGVNGDVCCQIQPIKEETCSEKGGKICSSDEKCSGTKVQSSDNNNCCKGNCEKIEQTNDCLDSGYNCKASCSKEEEQTGLGDCDFGQVCCGKKPSKPMNWLLVILLIILIILLILAIIYRRQLRIWIFKKKTGFDYGKPMPPSSRPSVFPQQIRPIFPPRPPPQRMYQSKSGIQARKPIREKDKEFEETMKKLRDMSK